MERGRRRSESRGGALRWSWTGTCGCGEGAGGSSAGQGEEACGRTAAEHRLESRSLRPDSCRNRMQTRRGAAKKRPGLRAGLGASEIWCLRPDRPAESNSPDRTALAGRTNVRVCEAWRRERDGCEVRCEARRREEARRRRGGGEEERRGRGAMAGEGKPGGTQWAHTGPMRRARRGPHRDSQPAVRSASGRTRSWPQCLLLIFLLPSVRRCGARGGGSCARRLTRAAASSLSACISPSQRGHRHRRARRRIIARLRRSGAGCLGPGGPRAAAPGKAADMPQPVRIGTRTQKTKTKTKTKTAVRMSLVHGTCMRTRRRRK